MRHHTTEGPLKATSYWEQRLARSFGVRGAGMRGRGEAFNRWAYRAKLRAVELALQRQGISLREKAVLDVGCGSGQYIPLWLSYQPSHFEGWDVTEASISQLRERYPDVQFRRCDIGTPSLAEDSISFDVVTALDLLFHITEEPPFRQALTNLRRLTLPGGYVLLSDYYLRCDAFRPARHVWFRSRDMYESALKDAGLTVIGTHPHTYWLNAPLDIRSHLPRMMAFWAWTIASRLTMFEPLGDAIGRMLHGLDVASMTNRTNTLSTKLIICAPTDN